MGVPLDGFCSGKIPLKWMMPGGTSILDYFRKPAYKDDTAGCFSGAERRGRGNDLE